MRRPSAAALLLAVALISGCTSEPGLTGTAGEPGATDSGEIGAPASGGPASTTPSAAAGNPAAFGSCPSFPSDNVWHAKVGGLPVHPNSAAYVGSIGSAKTVHADFGSGLYDGGPIGIPVTMLNGSTGGSSVRFEYDDESDPGPYPIPSGVAIEGGPNSAGDRHIILVDPSACQAYELYAAYPNGDGSWRAGSGARYDLRSNTLRPAGWTSADAAGLSILAGLVRYDGVASGHIDHAIRVTAPKTRNGYVWPARHAASSDSSLALPPMGLRLRLKSTVDISGLPVQAQVVARAMQEYGVILADNGSAWFISGTPDDRWNNDALHALGALKGSDFEAVDTAGLMVSPDSGAARPS
jgi:hypothetical protein